MLKPSEGRRRAPWCSPQGGGREHWDPKWTEFGDFDFRPVGGRSTRRPGAFKHNARREALGVPAWRTAVELEAAAG